MDMNNRINQLISENEMLKNLNKLLASGRDMAVSAAKELGYQFRTEVSPLDYLIETARVSVMVNQKNVELMADRNALEVQLLSLSRLHSDLTNADMVLDDGEHSGYLITSEQLEDMEHYLSEPILCLAAHDAEVAKATFKAGWLCRADRRSFKFEEEAENYAAQLRAKAKP